MKVDFARIHREEALKRLLGYLWAAPVTATAVAIGLLLLARFRVVDGVVEMHGPLIAGVLKRLPVSALALTLGHAVFARDDSSMAFTREHERVHVRQYARWGPLFIPAYLACSAWLYLRGRDGYRENPFEVEAFREEGKRGIGARRTL